MTRWKRFLIILAAAVFACGIGMWVTSGETVHGRVVYKSSVDQPDAGIAFTVVAIRDSQISRLVEKAGDRTIMNFDSQTKVVKDELVVGRTQSDRKGNYSLWIERGKYYVCLAKQSVELSKTSKVGLVGCKRVIVEESKNNNVDFYFQLGKIVSGY